MFLEASITNLSRFASDRYLILLTLKGEIANIKISFWFEKI